MKDIYPSWKMIVYYDSSVPKQTLEELEKNNVILVNCDNIPYDSFWRFFASDIEDSEYVVFRDCDSRISKREYLAVKEWIKSGKTLHVMRDHPGHGVPYGANGLGILAGMWGIKGKVLDMKKMISDFVQNKKNYYGIDQTFLQQIFLSYQNDKITHDEFFEKKPFPIKRENGRFIGERINFDETPLTLDFLQVL